MTMNDKKTYSDEERIELIAGHYKEILTLLGEDIEREGLRKTPYRAAKAMVDITSGYRKDAEEIAKKAIFEHTGSQIVIVRDIEFYSVCEHHILPFFGKISVGYIPKGKIIGLSKIPRIVEVYARRLQVQENLTGQICRFLSKAIPNDGIIVQCSAQHLCMMMRGVEKQNNVTETYDCTGKFVKDPTLRKEFFDLLK